MIISYYPVLTIFMVFDSLSFKKCSQLLFAETKTTKIIFQVLVRLNPGLKMNFKIRSPAKMSFKALGMPRQDTTSETVSTNISDSDYNLWGQKKTYYRVSLRIFVTGNWPEVLSILNFASFRLKTQPKVELMSNNI